MLKVDAVEASIRSAHLVLRTDGLSKRSCSTYIASVAKRALLTHLFLKRVESEEQSHRKRGTGA